MTQHVTSSGLDVTEVVPNVTPVVMPRGVEPCPHCGFPMVVDAVARKLPQVQRRIYEVIRDAGTFGIGWREIMGQVYADDPNGGPTSNTVSVLIHQHINPSLRDAGLMLRATRGQGSRYYLRTLEP